MRVWVLGQQTPMQTKVCHYSPEKHFLSSLASAKEKKAPPISADQWMKLHVLHYQGSRDHEQNCTAPSSLVPRVSLSVCHYLHLQEHYRENAPTKVCQLDKRKTKQTNSFSLYCKFLSHGVYRWCYIIMTLLNSTLPTLKWLDWFLLDLSGRVKRSGGLPLSSVNH